MALYGRIDPYDSNLDDWRNYSERMKQYFFANDVSDEKKKTSIFLTIIGAQTYKLLKSLITPTDPSTKSVQYLSDRLEKHFCPASIEIAERYKFYSRNQNAKESLKCYMAILRDFATSCSFGEFLENALRDRYVCGLRDESIRSRLLLEKNLTYESAIELSQNIESTSALSNASSLPPIQKHGVGMNNYMNTQTKPFNDFRGQQEKRFCFRCNNENHLANTCPYRNEKCRNCRKNGHPTFACRKKAINCNLVTVNNNYCRQPKYKRGKWGPDIA